MAHLFHQRWFRITLLVVLVLTLYSFMLQGEYKTLDDEASIVRNDLIKDVRHAPQILRSSYFGVNDYYRPLVLLSYMLEYHVFGLDAFYYYLDNVFLHIASALLVFLIFTQLLPSSGLAFGASLLYAIHPVHWEAVSNIPGRAILLCAFFTFLAFWLFLQRKRSGLFYILSLVAFVLALLCKESAGVFPLVLFSYQLFLGRGIKDRWWQWPVPVAPYFVLVIPYLVTRKLLGITELFYPRDAGESLLGFLTFLRGVISYLRILFIPADLHFDRSYRFLRGIMNFDVLLIAVVYGLLVWLLVRYWRKIPAVVWFLLSWFAIELLPVSQLLVSIGIQPGYISLAEHFLYVASVGFFGVLVLAARQIALWNRERRVFSPVLGPVLVVCFFGYLMLTLVENNIYSSREVAMLERTVQMDPHNGRIRLSLALAYGKQKRFADAEASFRQALDIDPHMNIRAKLGLAKSLSDQGKLWEALELYESIPPEPKFSAFIETNRNATLEVLQKKYEASVAQDSHDPMNWYALGIVYSKLGQNGRAAQNFDQAVIQKPDFREAWFNRGASYALLEQWQPAIESYEKTLSLSQADDVVRYQANVFLAMIYRGQEQQSKYDKEAGRIKVILESKNR